MKKNSDHRTPGERNRKSYALYFVFLAFCSAIFLSGCSEPVRERPASYMRSFPSAGEGLTVDQTEKEKGSMDLPDLGLGELPVDQVEEPMTRISLSVRNADIKDILIAISNETAFNIVADPEVAGNITVDLEDVTLRQALDVVLKPLKLIYRVEDNLIIVSKQDMETRMFTFNYVPVSRTGGGGVGAGGGGGTTGGMSGGGGSVSSTFSADLWTDIETEIKALMSSEKAKITINQMAGIIMVTDYPDTLERIDKYLKAVESSVQRQIFIQAEIIEVILSDDYQMGVDWSALTRYDFSIEQSLAVGSSFLQVGKLGDKFSMLFDVLSTQGEVNILSNPKISVMNSQKAIIKIGKEDVYWRVKTEVEPTTGTRIETTSPQTITVGLMFDVTPHIGADGTLTMHIHPSITDKTGESQSRLGDTMPVIEIREVDTVVKVKDGQTLVLGGILQDKTSRNVNRIPILSRIPLLGRLFMQTRETKHKSELVVLLTPRIVESSMDTLLLSSGVTSGR